MNEKFEYNYSAPTTNERKEIEEIRKQYIGESTRENKMKRLRYLHNKVTSIPMVIALCLGVSGVLFFGLGLTFFLEWTHAWLLGIPCALIGFALMIPAYPMFVKYSREYKEKYKDEIISLSEELLNSCEEE